MSKKMKILVSVGLGMILAGCTSLDTHMTATADINPDIAGNPSPLAVSVFELTDTEAFMAADFMHLYTSSAMTLGRSLLAEENVMLVPGTHQTVSMPLVKGVHAVAYVAAYQNLSQVNWRASVKINPQFLAGIKININFNNQGIVVVQS